MNYKYIGTKFKDRLGMKLSIVGITFSDIIPKEAISYKKKTKVCIMPLIIKSAKGSIIAFNHNYTAKPCAKFYLGYTNWISPGVESFLSNEEVNNRKPEHFIKNKELALSFLKENVPDRLRNNVIIIKPLEKFHKNEKPEVVIFFANADQLSGLVYLINYNSPTEERISAPFASACSSVFSLPLKYAKQGINKAVWGLHDISARKRLPKDLMSLSMPYQLFEEMYANIDDSFLNTENWEIIKKRNN